MSWEDQTEEILKSYSKGDTVKAKILDVDPEKERVALGIKQLTDDPFEGSMKGMAKGAVVTCTVTAVNDKDIEVSVNDGVTGIIKKTDLSRERSEQRTDRYAVGEKLDAKVTSVDKKNRKLTLSIKAYEIDEDKAALKAFGSTESGASLGDILGAALDKADDSEEKSESAEITEETPKEKKKKATKKAAKKETAISEKSEEEKESDA